MLSIIDIFEGNSENVFERFSNAELVLMGKIKNEQYKSSLFSLIQFWKSHIISFKNEIHGSIRNILIV